MSEGILQVVFKKGILFDITIGRWSALHQMKTGDLLLEKLNRKVIYPGHKKLLPEEYAYPVIHVEGKIRTFVRKHSLDFPISGAVFVNFKTLPKMLEGLKKLKLEFDHAAENLFLKWEEIKAKQVDVLDEEARKIAVQNGLYEKATPEGERQLLKTWLKEQHKKNLSLYPPKEELLAKYYVTWAMFKVNPLDDASVLTDADAEIIGEQQAKLKSDMEKWVKAKSVEIHKAIGEAAAATTELLAANGKLTPKNLKPLFAAFEQFKAVDFAGSSFAQVIDDIEKKYLTQDLEVVASSVNGNTDEFGLLLNTISKLAVDEAAAQAGAVYLANSEFKRVVEL